MFITKKRHEAELKALEEMYEAECAKLRDLITKLNAENNDLYETAADLDDALVDILNQVTPGANATVRRIKGIAEKALGLDDDDVEDVAEADKVVGVPANFEGTLADLRRAVIAGLEEQAQRKSGTKSFTVLRNGKGGFDWTGLDNED